MQNNDLFKHDNNYRESKLNHFCIRRNDQCLAIRYNENDCINYNCLQKQASNSNLKEKTC